MLNSSEASLIEMMMKIKMMKMKMMKELYLVRLNSSMNFHLDLESMDEV